MNIAEFSIKKNVLTWLIVVICVVGGTFSYFNIGRFEDPEFTIKEALVKTYYPGATPKEVEQEVTDEIEKAAQQLPQLKRVKSISMPGMSEVTVVIQDKYTRHDLPQIWDELRRKINDVQSQLPPGVKPSIVYDDYGDVFGMLYAITGKGFSYKEIKKYADLIQRELYLVKGVGKINLTGIRQQAIFVDISRTKIAQMGISLEQIYKTLGQQNLVAESGSVRVGDEYIRISPTGEISSVKAIGNLLVYSNKSKKLIHLDDIAKVTRGYTEVPHYLAYYNGQPALIMGISIASGGNVVKIGDAVEKRIQELQSVIPAGIEINSVYEQPKVVTESIDNFMVSLLQALAIVIVVLLLFMGMRSGLIIAAILLLTVAGTLFVMYIFDIYFQRISLGALIIALGMLVDNAIVVAEGILIKVEQGIDKITASKEVVSQTMWPLFGATIVGILAFAAIGLSQDSTGEYTRTLFYVILISLLLSWFLAITVAPLFCYLFLKSGKQSTTDPYAGKFYQGYKKFLTFSLHRRWITVIIMLIMLFAAGYGFKFVKQSFFPDSTTPIFLLDYWRAQGTDIRSTRDDMLKIEKHLRNMPGITDVTLSVGNGMQRFMLVYTPEKLNSAYGQLIVEVKDYRQIDNLIDKVRDYLAENFPNSEPKFRKIRLGPGSGSKIEVRFSGQDLKVLRALSEKAQALMRKIPNAIEIRDDWRQQVKIIRPIFNEQQARVTGISRADLADALQNAFSGKQVGVYREKDELIPIISRPPAIERLNIANIDDLQIWSPLLEKAVPIGQVVSKFETRWENNKLHRYNRRLTITTSCEPKSGPASIILNQLLPELLKLKIPPGYFMELGGEYESSHDAQAALAVQLPLGIILMILTVILLFGKIKQPTIIWLCVPLSIIGVTAGLLLTNTEFGFMALLGLLSLSGMLIKNAIVLVDQIDLEITEGKPRFQAIVDSSISRMRPVVLAAVTTVLGMIPLIFDAFFYNMAIVIMFGLSFATVLTLIVVPVLYQIFFKIKNDEISKA
jgi:multidrug efflux pump subunit AcrB